MGTRADFYVGRGKTAEWVGSVTWDGYPAGIAADNTPSGRLIFVATDEPAYRSAVSEFLGQREDNGSTVTRPDEPWPWPWLDSNTSDYAYAYDGAVFATGRGGWWKVDPAAPEFGEPDEGEFVRVELPDMSARQGDLAQTMAKSGLIVLEVPQ
jgi:hypothetical protein